MRRARGWHDLHIGHRLSVLGCFLLMSGGALAALLSTQAQSTVGLTVVGSTTINVFAVPEKRIPSSNNNSTRLTVEVRAVGTTTPIDSELVVTGSGGGFSGITLQINPGTYDITAKGYSHLRRLKSSVAITNGTTVDFSDAHTYKLLSGDVNSTDGDNKVNGIDLSLIVTGLLGSSERLDLNRDSIVNGIDLTNAVTNLNVTGDS